MTLLKFIAYVDKCDESIIKKIKQCISNRVTWMEMREPEFEGKIFELWEEKYETLVEIMELIELWNPDDDNFEDIKDLIIDYQNLYGGLSRICIEEVSK